VSFLLDTNICSAHLRRPAGLAHRFFQHTGRLSISTVVLGELFSWAYHQRDPRPTLLALDLFVQQEVNVLLYDPSCAEEFGKLQAQLARAGIAVPHSDLMIAATAIVHNLTLVTHNTADFQYIPSLRLEDWLIP
jgi:tRNA(fMet)-specific endonuclease VapC